MSVIKSRYTIPSNKPLSETFDRALYSMSYKIPTRFKNSNGKKMIKVFGCSFGFLESEDKKLIPSTRYTNQILTVHSNIARDNTEHPPSFYPEAPKSGIELHENESVDCFMMTTNNYNTPKIYDLTNSDLQDITIWFKDSYRQLITIRGAYSSDGGYLDGIYQTVFKIECELAVI
jgi:hypothetical protein